jgi:hypothetical protein
MIVTERQSICFAAVTLAPGSEGRSGRWLDGLSVDQERCYLFDAWLAKDFTGAHDFHVRRPECASTSNGNPFEERLPVRAQTWGRRRRTVLTLPKGLRKRSVRPPPTQRQCKAETNKPRPSANLESYRGLLSTLPAVQPASQSRGQNGRDARYSGACTKALPRVP